MVRRNHVLMALAPLVLVAAAWTAGPAAAAVPYCEFTSSPAEPLVGETVYFDASASYDPDGVIVIANWSFGDGHGGSGGMYVQHVYTAAGTYTASLAICDNEGNWNNCSETIAIYNSQPPTCSITWTPEQPLAEQPVFFDSHASDPDGTVVSVDWTFGDGAVGSGLVASHTYTVAGSFTVTCTVTDNSDDIRQCSQAISVGEACPPGTINTAAGNGTVAYCGDGGDATLACLNWPMGVAVSTDGSVYIADTWNHRIRKVDPDGIITTVAGNGVKGYSGDGGPATAASFDQPIDVAVAADGALYIVDNGNSRIRKVDTGGTVTTVAGTGVGGYSGDGGPATSAMLSIPRGVAVGADGSFYIADYQNHRIRKVDTGGIITTVAGNGNWGYSGDGGPATSAMLWGPSGVAVGADGSFYIADLGNHRIRKVDTGGIITTVAGTGIGGYSGDGGPATSANLYQPWAVALAEDGSFYIADYYNHRIREVDSAGVITTVAGDGTAGYGGDGGPATSASLYQPQGVALGGNGVLYIGDTRNHRIRKVCASLAPACDISYSPAAPGVGEQVDFDSHAYDPDGGALVSVDWTFGDGGTASGVITSHTYTSPGSYTVTCTVTDDEADSISCQVTVDATADPPVCSFAWTPASPLVGDTVSFDSTASTDPDSTIVAWSWDFGDEGTSTDQNPTHTYASGGCFEVTLTITDTQGMSDTLSKCVPVRSDTETPFCDAGWHMIAQPHAGDHALADVSVRDDKNKIALSFCDAVPDWVQNPLFQYDTTAAGYRLCGCEGIAPPTTEHTLRMSSGYWLYTFQDYLTLVFP